MVNVDAVVAVPRVADSLGLAGTRGRSRWRGCSSTTARPPGDGSCCSIRRLPGSSPITIDLTTASDAEAIDRLDLAACYGFHGIQVEHEIGVAGLGDRPAERFAFDERDARTEVITWQTRVAGGVQRVVVSQLAGDRAAVAQVAAAVSAVTADIYDSVPTAMDRDGGLTA